MEGREGHIPEKDNDKPAEAIPTIALPPNAVLQRVPTIVLSPSAVLQNVATDMNGKVKGIEITLPILTTWKTALSAASSSIQDDHDIQLHPPMTRAGRKVLQARALAEVQRQNRLSQPSQPLKIRNATDSRSLPIPSPLTPAQRQKLKENVHRFGGGDYDPYAITIRTSLEDGRLVGISGSIVLTAIDSDSDDPHQLRIQRDDMLWDTGAHTSFVSEGLLDDDFRNFLQDEIHDAYRNEERASVQLSGIFSFSNTSLRVDTTCTVVPFLPNKRVGILLGQGGLIDRISHRMIPRDILRAKGETVEDGEYGDIVIEEFMDLEDNVVQVNP